MDGHEIMVAQKEILMDEKNIKIVTFQSYDGVSYGTNFSATKAENVSLYNDSIIESENIITDFQNKYG